MPLPSLSTLALGLGLLLALPQLYALKNPAGWRAFLLRFPRHEGLGWALMLAATGWFLWLVSDATLADFSRYRPHMMVAFGAIGLLTCVYVKDYLAARGASLLLLLLAYLMLEVGRRRLGDTPFVYLNQLLAYVWAVAGMWFTISPWRLRDALEWNCRTDARIKAFAAARLALGLLFVALSFTAFRAGAA
jgi:uncharacterized membrane protein